MLESYSGLPVKKRGEGRGKCSDLAGCVTGSWGKGKFQVYAGHPGFLKAEVCLHFLKFIFKISNRERGHEVKAGPGLLSPSQPPEQLPPSQPTRERILAHPAPQPPLASLMLARSTQAAGKVYPRNPSFSQQDPLLTLSQRP